MSISLNTKQAYSEVDEFIELLDDIHKNEIPKKIRDFFREEKDTSYVKNINPKIHIGKQNLKDETLAIIALLNLEYWCKDEEEKERLKKIYFENEQKYQEDLRKKYNPENLFKNKGKEVKNIILASQEMISYKPKSLIQKLFEKIKSIFIKK